jgi:hypothetical protein
MIPVHVALIDQSGEVMVAALELCAGALNEQIQADVAPVWNVRATVGYYDNASVPPMTWQIVIEKQLDQPGALGYHTNTNNNNQPISYVAFTQDWSVTVSHELIEMLVDPFGNRTTSALLPLGMESQFAQFGLSTEIDRVHYLLEACDPCEGMSYPVGTVPMSDFLTPNWYRSAPVGCGSYSHAGGCKSPREVANDGYVSFCNSQNDWYQVFNQGGTMQVQNLGKFDATKFGSLREFVDTKAREYRAF